ncbi:MAG: hypothetical protein ACKOZU_05400 [Planctomycetaceae bacterium]
MQPPPAARGTDVVDRAGRPVGLRGVSWFGMETETHVPHGIWARDDKEMILEVAPHWLIVVEGVRQAGLDTPEGVWPRSFVEFLAAKKLGFIHWSWNPNSGDTGGLVGDDWLTIVATKRELLAPLLDR